MLGTHLGNRWGYDIEFDGHGRSGDLRIDFTALAELLFQLQQAAQRRGVGIAQVIVDPRYQARLLAAPRGQAIASMPFMKGEAWWRHDEHVHVDFKVACKPL